METGEVVADTEVVEQICTVGGVTCYRTKRSDGSEATVCAVEDDVSQEMFDHFLAGASDCALEEPIEGVATIVEIDPIARAYVADAAALGTMLDLPLLAWPPARLYAFFGSLAQTLERVHQREATHGSLRPESVLLVDDFQPMLLNMGCVDVAAQARCNPSSAHCTYAAPEVIKGADADSRSDIYSLGRLVHFMLLGKEPGIIRDEVPKLDNMPESAPPGLIRIARRAMMLDPAQRYASMTELDADCQLAIAGQPVGSLHPEVDDTGSYAAAYTALSAGGLTAEGSQAAAQSVSGDVPSSGGETIPSEDVVADPLDTSLPTFGTSLKPSNRYPAPPNARSNRGKSTAKSRSSKLASSKRGGLARSGAAGRNKPELDPVAQAKKRMLLGFAVGALLLVGTPIGVFLDGNDHWLLLILCTSSAVAFSYGFQGVGPNKLLSRVALGVTIAAAVIFVDPTAFAAANSRDRLGLKEGQVGPRVEALKNLLATGEVKLMSLDLEGGDVSGMDFTNITLDGSSLRDANCSDTNFGNASLVNVDFGGANLAGAKMSKIMVNGLRNWTDSKCSSDTAMPSGWLCVEESPAKGSL